MINLRYLMFFLLFDTVLANAEAPSPKLRNQSGGWNLNAMPETLDGRWRLVERQNFHLVYIDTKSITRTSDDVVVWLKTFYREPWNVLGMEMDKDKLPVTSLEHTFVNCRNREIAWGEHLAWSRTGATISYSLAADSSRKYVTIKPDGRLDERLYETLCIDN